VANQYGCELWRDYSIESPVKVDRLKVDFNDLPGHYPQLHHDNIWVAIDWRNGPTDAAWDKSKKVILVYPKSAKSMLRYWPRDLHALSDYLMDAEEHIKHELRHVVQTILLPPEQHKQTYSDATSKVDYNMSPNEFDPIIGTLAAQFVQHYQVMINYGKKPSLSKMVKQAVGISSPEIGEKPAEFFTILKRRSPQKYRLAVKKYVTEITSILGREPQ